jgi:hypothetical protein
MLWWWSGPTKPKQSFSRRRRLTHRCQWHVWFLYYYLLVCVSLKNCSCWISSHPTLLLRSVPFTRHHHHHQQKPKLPSLSTKMISRYTRSNRSTRSTTLLVMKDRSCSYWFQVGDSVRVISTEVQKNGVNLYHRVGMVMETWEKCNVDPTCCCAEQVDPNMAVRVAFDGGLIMTQPQQQDHDDDTQKQKQSSFCHYFAESELEKYNIIIAQI